MNEVQKQALDNFNSFDRRFKAAEKATKDIYETWQDANEVENKARQEYYKAYDALRESFGVREVSDKFELLAELVPRLS